MIGIPTDERLRRYAAGGDDPDLEEALFNYGRYLLISSSRGPGLPANLQGLWNHSNNPPWASDYHSNINLQMNYWAAETTNLAECNIPLLTFIDACRPSCRSATRRAFGDSVQGWTARTSQSIFGGNGWEWNIPASAWYMQHVYEHWAFNPDTGYLKYIAYPMMREVCEFWAGRLIEKNGWLMAPDGWSPEHGPKANGVIYDQQVVWDLFRNFLVISGEAAIDAEFHRKISGMQQRLAPNRIGKWGQLQEWQEDIDDPEDQHRHTSHLFAVFPGCQITPDKTPELARAARISLLARSGNLVKGKEQPFKVESMSGDSRRSWTWPWRGALWARLGDGEKAAMMIRGLMTYNMLSNLFSNHPPFQIDGNLAIPATMAEMLIQSHDDGIHLLPAIPQRWAAEGYFKGLKARGGFTVDCIWEQGQVTEYRIISEQPAKVKVTCNGKTTEVMSQKSEK
jgi:alpha-L-fucosidase 2